MEISNESLMKILKHQNRINQLIMGVLEIQPTVVSKNSVPLPRLVDKIKNVIGVDILTANEVIESVIIRFPELIKDIKARYKGCYRDEGLIDYDAHVKLRSRVRNCLSNRNNFIITGVHNPHNNLRKKYSNNTA